MAQGPRQAKTSRRPDDLSRLNVVIIDGDHATSSMLSGILRASRIDQTTVFPVGLDALERLTTEPRLPAQLLLIDWRCAVPPCDELIRRIRRTEARQVQEIPIIVIMNSADRDNVLRARDSGAHAVIARPYSAAQLLEKITWAVTADITFVRAERYVGPDRRRFRGIEYEGEERRHS